MDKHILVAGFGNTLMGDDGIGPRVVALLQAMDALPDVELVDAGTSALDLQPYLENKRLAIFVDAVRAGCEPGAIVRFNAEDIIANRGDQFSLHTLRLADALRLWQLQIPALPEIVVIGMEPERIGLGLALSPTIEERLPLLCKVVLEEIERG